VVVVRGGKSSEFYQGTNEVARRTTPASQMRID
jgi:hypothetical protein